MILRMPACLDAERGAQVGRGDPRRAAHPRAAPSKRPARRSRFWVDEQGVTHFTDDPEAIPDARRHPAGDAEAIEPLRAAWDDGVVGPAIVARGDSSSPEDRIGRLLRGALADLERGEVARADATVLGRAAARPAPRRGALVSRGAGPRARAIQLRPNRICASSSTSAGPRSRLGGMRRRSVSPHSPTSVSSRTPNPSMGPLELELVAAEHFRVQVDARLGCGLDRLCRAGAAGFLEEARRDVSNSIGVEPLEPLGVVLYGRAAYVRAHSHRFSFQTIGFFDGRIHVASPAHPTETLRGILFHEYTHAVYREQTGGDRPYWLNEGLRRADRTPRPGSWRTRPAPSVRRCARTSRPVPGSRSNRSPTALAD